MNQNYRLDPVLLFLASGMSFFALALIFVEWKFKDDGQVFQVFAQLLSGFGGAILIRVKPQTKEEERPGTATTVVHNASDSTTIIPPEPKP